MNCSYCTSSNAIKKGKRNNKQRFYCKECNKSFQLNYSYQAYKVETNNFIRSLLKESCGVRSIGRILSISTKTVLSRMLNISKQIRVPYFNTFGCKFEVDELFIKIANGKSQNWLTYAIEQQTKQVIGFIIGSRNTETLKQVIDKVLLLKPKRIYTDKLNIYLSIIPKEIHKRFQYCTNRIERMNLNLRTHIKRLSRKTICYSKKLEYLEAHLKVYFWG
ncbi:Probable transposase IS1 family [Tenacibaculum litoreum]|uniref:IS1 family transposase n=1 Tax=Tenacibaculum litoreum TaxID=321269 RepID=UPI003892E523